MNDVAREAGVALKTVSRYVNGETNVNPELAKRIADAIRTLGYRRNLAAASLRPGQTSRVLGLVIGDIANPFYAALTGAVERGAQARDHMLITASSEESGVRHDKIVVRLLGQQVDGLIVVPPREVGASWEDLNPYNVPVVFVDRPASARSSDTVLADNFGGAYAATTQLIDEGCRRIAFLGDNLDIFTMSERLRGFTEALAARSLTVAPELVISNIHSASDGVREVAALLDPTVGVDGIFAANNRAALGSLRAFSGTKRRLPLIGFDDFEAAQLGEPPVSVVTQDIIGMGTSAVSMLFERIENPDLEARTVVHPTQLVLRGSERVQPA